MKAAKASTPPAVVRPTGANHPIGYAVVGLGHITQVAVLPGFAQAKNARVVALVSGEKKKRDELGAKYGVTKLYDYEQFDECLADPLVEAVYIALPNDQHYEYVTRAAAAKKHILCEKPLALNSNEARLMIQAAASHKVKLMTAYRLHFEPANLSTIELVKSGALGDVRYFNASFSYNLDDSDNIRLQYARGGGPVYDIGTYCINAARYLMQDEPEEVAGMLARSGDPRFNEVEETASALLRFPRGRLATFVVSFGAATVSRYEIVGTKGRVVLEPAFDYSLELRQVVTIGEKTEEKTFARTDQFGGQIEAFSECIRHNREPEPSGREGLADVRIIEAIFASDARSRHVRIAPFKKTVRPALKQVKRKPAVKKPKVVGVDAPHD